MCPDHSKEYLNFNLSGNLWIKFKIHRINIKVTYKYILEKYRN